MELLASGRDCDVFALDDHTVLRRERAGRSLEREALVMHHVRAHGFPCPEVRDTVGADMVMERLVGTTLTEYVLATPNRLVAGAVLLADLHHRLHALPPMASGQGSVLHLDLHPENVLMSADGPVVIDWTNASHGDPAVDMAMTWIILQPYVDVIDGVGVFVEAFLEAVGREVAVAGLTRAGKRRLGDKNTTDQEAAAIRALLDRT